MSRGALMRWTARRLPGIPAAIRDDLVVAADGIADRAGPASRALEVGGIVGFALRASTRRGTSDDGWQVVRQGVWVGGLVLGLTTALVSWARVADAKDVLVALASSLLAGSVAGGYRAPAVALATTVVGVALLGGGPAVLGALVLGAVVIGVPYDARPCPVGATLAGLGAVCGGVVATAIPAAAGARSIEVAVLVVSALLLAIGWFDPRLAVAAAVVWSWRLVDVDAPVLTAMALGAWLVTDLAIRRTVPARHPR